MWFPQMWLHDHVTSGHQMSHSYHEYDICPTGFPFVAKLWWLKKCRLVLMRLTMCYNLWQCATVCDSVTMRFHGCGIHHLQGPSNCIPQAFWLGETCEKWKTRKLSKTLKKFIQTMQWCGLMSVTFVTSRCLPGRCRTEANTWEPAGFPVDGKNVWKKCEKERKFLQPSVCQVANKSQYSRYLWTFWTGL